MKKSITGKKITALILTALISALTLTSCASNAAKDSDFYDVYTYSSMKSEQNNYSGGWGVTEDGAAAEIDESYAKDYFAETEEAPTAALEPQAQQQAKRKIIYTSNYDIQTKNYDASVAALDALMTKYGAYFESSNTYGSAESGSRRSNFTVRVPVNNYTAFVNEAGTLGVVVSSSQNNKDVTEAYFDTEARLESARIREERVLEILRNAAMLDDVLALERELADIRYEIESYTGALRKYDSLVNYSTVTISLNEVTDVVVPKTTPLTFGERMNKGFFSGINDFVQGLQDFAVFLSYNFIGIIIWAAIIAAAVILIVRLIKKSRKGRSSAKTASDSAENLPDGKNSGNNKDDRHI